MFLFVFLVTSWRLLSWRFLSNRKVKFEMMIFPVGLLISYCPTPQHAFLFSFSLILGRKRFDKPLNISLSIFIINVFNIRNLGLEIFRTTLAYNCKSWDFWFVKENLWSYWDCFRICFLEDMRKRRTIKRSINWRLRIIRKVNFFTFRAVHF